MTYALVIIIVMVATFFITRDENAQSFTLYIIAFFMILGWFLLFFTMGVGLIAVPFDLIYEFFNRPIPIKQAEFEVKKKILLDNLLFMRKRCNETLEERTKIDTQKGFKGWWNNARLTRKVASIQIKTHVLEREYIKLVKLSKFNKFIEPMKYYLKLALGIFCIILDLVIIVQLVGCQLIMPSDEERCAYDYLNTFIKLLSRDSVGLGFITTAIILIFSVYLLLCAYYGNFKLGVRFVIYTY